MSSSGTCLKMVLDPEPSSPSNKSFCTLFCSRYSGINLLEGAEASSLNPGVFSGGVGNENSEQIRRVDAYLAKQNVITAQ